MKSAIRIGVVALALTSGFSVSLRSARAETKRSAFTVSVVVSEACSMGVEAISATRATVRTGCSAGSGGTVAITADGTLHVDELHGGRGVLRVSGALPNAVTEHRPAQVHVVTLTF